jgi:hypothetical protein
MADLPSGIQPVTVEHCATEEYKKNPNKKCVVGFMLTCHHSSASDGDRNIRFTSTSTFHPRPGGRASRLLVTSHTIDTSFLPTS